MFHRTVSKCFTPALLVALLLVPWLASSAMADRWEDSAPARTTAGELEDHEATSSDPSDHEAESGEMQPGYSDDPEDLVVDSEEMDVVETEEVEDHEGATTALQDLRLESPDDGLDTIDDGRLDDVDDNHLSARQLVAKRHLEHAQTQASVARTRYGDMMRDNYPRGAARISITEHRDETMKALEKARAEFDAAMGN